LTDFNELTYHALAVMKDVSTLSASVAEKKRKQQQQQQQQPQVLSSSQQNSIAFSQPRPASDRPYVTVDAEMKKLWNRYNNDAQKQPAPRSNYVSHIQRQLANQGSKTRAPSQQQLSKTDLIMQDVARFANHENNY
jgi:hypothetical protein